VNLRQRDEILQVLIGTATAFPNVVGNENEIASATRYGVAGPLKARPGHVLRLRIKVIVFEIMEDRLAATGTTKQDVAAVTVRPSRDKGIVIEVCHRVVSELLNELC
jgi:hypothetical protein